ncbi:MAG: hypothetical protein WAV45_13660 [Propionibacteriaceae bacterium]|nr:hypothetical protein [Micropruina sp.]HBY23447.1 hypothetical protein [Propionibacteriaceae bacterium]
MTDDAAYHSLSAGWIRRTAWLIPAVLLAIYLGWLSVSHPTSDVRGMGSTVITCPALLGNQDAPSLYDGLTPDQSRAVTAYMDEHRTDRGAADLRASAIQAIIRGCEQARQNRQTWIFLVGIATLGSLVISSHFSRRRT